MPKYRVEVYITRSTCYTVELEAEDKDDAESEAVDMALGCSDHPGSVSEGDTDTVDTGTYDGTEVIG